MTVGVVVFARLDSRRLPGKVLAPVAGRPLLGRVLDRLRRVRAADALIVATSDRPGDDAIAAYAEGEGIDVFRGAGDDVLGRARACADAFGLDALVRVSGDSPFIDPDLVDAAIRVHRDEGPDLTTNVFPRTYPQGVSVEVIAADALARIAAAVNDGDDREHVTRYLYRHPDDIRIRNLSADGPPAFDVRLTVDTAEDLARADWIAARAPGDPADLTLDQVIDLARRWHAGNAGARPRVVASIAARMNATRLPGKVLADVGGVPALTRLVRRLRRARRIDAMVLATTDDAADDVLADWARREDVPCYRGDAVDVLGRVVAAQRMMGAEVAVRVNADTPLIDPALVDRAVGVFTVGVCDVVTTTRPHSYPQGVDVEVVRLADLEQVADTVTDPAVREHVTLHFYEHHDRYDVLALTAPVRLRAPDLRLQVDYAEDLELVRQIYARLEPAHGDDFGIAHILELLKQEPALRDINRHRSEKAVR